MHGSEACLGAKLPPTCYIVTQVLGGYVGVVRAHAMFGLPLFSASRHNRSGVPQTFSEFIATFGLLSVIWGCSQLRTSVMPFVVGHTSRRLTGSVYFVRQSRRDSGEGSDRHFRWHSSGGCSGIHCGTVCCGQRRQRLCTVVSSEPTGGCAKCSGSRMRLTD
jgi:hypothetical protein